MDKTIWINRGIIISLIYIILKIYNKLKDKYLIIKQTYIREFLQFLFPKLKFINNKKNRYSNDSDSDDDHKDYFDFFIRSTPSKADNNYVVIDYLSNYNKIIPTDELWLVPYYDENDPLVLYLYKHSSLNDSKDTKYLKTKEQYQIINDFSRNKRYNYNSDIHPDIKNWDLFFESSTLARYNRNGFVQKSINLSENPPKTLLDMINNYLSNKLFLNDSEEMLHSKSNESFTSGEITNSTMSNELSNINNQLPQPVIFIPQIIQTVPTVPNVPNVPTVPTDPTVPTVPTNSNIVKILPTNNIPVSNTGYENEYIDGLGANNDVNLSNNGLNIEPLLDVMNEKILNIIKIFNNN
jgi:hypothetical protein